MNYCLICHKKIETNMTWCLFIFHKKQKRICNKCIRRLELLNGEKCKVCSRMLEREHYSKDGVCYDCQRWKSSSSYSGLLEQNISVFVYNDFMREVIYRWKFRGDYIVMHAFENYIREVFTAAFLEGDLIIVPIPLSEKRLYERGFNQADAIAKMLHYPSIELLRRSEDEEKQSQKSREGRLQSLSPFIATTPLKPLQDKHFILIDDIYTTGTTLRHAANILKPYTYHPIRSFTLIRS